MVKKLIISILLVSLIIFTGYLFKDVSINESVSSEDRFVEVYDQLDYIVIVDKKTKVLYLQSKKGFMNQGYGGLTVLVDSEGKPLLWGE